MPAASPLIRPDTYAHRCGMPVRTFVFIGGLHRSGTTMLARVLASHPAASGLSGTGVSEDEGQHLQRVYPPADRYGGPGRFGFASQMHLTEGSALPCAQARRRLLEAWAPYWDLRRPILIEKSPPNLLKMRFLQAVFPDARFIVLMRHPIAVALATQKWSGTSVGELIRHWLVCHETMLEDATRLDRFLLVRYEDLADDWERELEVILRFIAAPAWRSEDAPRAGVNERYFSRWEAAARRPAGRVRAALAAWRFEERVARFGYSLRDPGRRSDRPLLAHRDVGAIRFGAEASDQPAAFVPHRSGAEPSPGPASSEPRAR